MKNLIARSLGMKKPEKSNLQKVVDLLEENGFHVVEAVEYGFGNVQVKMSPKQEGKKKC